MVPCNTDNAWKIKEIPWPVLRSNLYPWTWANIGRDRITLLYFKDLGLMHGGKSMSNVHLCTILCIVVALIWCLILLYNEYAQNLWYSRNHAVYITSRNGIYHHISSYIIIYHYVSSYIIIYHHISSYIYISTHLHKHIYMTFA